MIFVFEGKSIDPSDKNLFFDHSLSLHKTFDSAKAALDIEKNYLLKNQFSLTSFKLFDDSGKNSIECLLTDCFSNERILTVNEWSVFD